MCHGRILFCFDGPIPQFGRQATKVRIKTIIKKKKKQKQISNQRAENLISFCVHSLIYI